MAVQDVRDENRSQENQRPRHQWRGRLGSRLAIVGGVLWISGIVAAWYALHRPIPLGVFEAVGGWLFDLSALVLIAAAAFWFGLLVLELVFGLSLESEAGNDNNNVALFAFGIGLGSFGLLILSGGMLHIPFFVFTPFYVLIVLAAYARFRRRGIRFQSLRQWLASLRLGETDWLSRLLCKVVICVTLCTLLLALCPPIAWDSLMYHVAVSHAYVQQGYIGYQRDIIYSNYPFGTEMFYTLSLYLGSDTLAQVWHWLFGLLGGWAAASLAGRIALRAGWAERAICRSRWFVAVLYLTTPIISTLMTWAYTDLSVAFYATLSFYAAWRAIELRMMGLNSIISLHWVILAGVCGGFAFGAKYSGLIAVAAVAAALGLWAFWSGAGWLRVIQVQVVYWWAALACFAPWAIKNLLLSGNPLAPMLGGTKGWTTPELATITSGGHGAALGLADIFRLPWALSVAGTTGGEFDATFSPLYLALVPLAVWGVWALGKSGRALVGLWLALLLYYVGWLLASAYSVLLFEGRMLVPAFPLFAVACGLGLGAALQKMRLRLLSIMTLVVVTLFSLIQVLTLVLTVAANNSPNYLLGFQNRSSWLQGQLGAYYTASQYINALPSTVRIAALWESRSYYIDRTLVPDLNIGQWQYLLDRYKSAANIKAAMQAQGYSHVLISERGLHFILDNYHPSPAYNAILDDLRHDLHLVYQTPGDVADSYSIYSLDDGGTP